MIFNKIFCKYSGNSETEDRATAELKKNILFKKEKKYAGIRITFFGISKR
jgi:hypothetical protein